MTQPFPFAFTGLRDSEDLGPGLLRVAAGLIDHVVGRIEAEGDDRSEDVHQIRTGLKRLRAVVRFVRPALSTRSAKRELAVFRHAGRHFALARDGYVLVHTIEALADRLSAVGDPDPALQHTLALLRERDRETVRHVLDHDDPELREVIGSLRAARTRWDPAAVGVLAGGIVPAEAAAGLAATFRRGRKAMDAARQAPTPGSLHEWRKRVKDLRYQVEVLAPVVVAVAHLEDPLIALSDALGEDHDLAELQVAVEGGSVDRSSIEGLLSDLARRQTELERQAWNLGAAVYRTDPSVLASAVEAAFNGA